MVTSAPTSPKYWQVAQCLKGEMQAGRLRPGDRVPSRAEMQTRFNISRATVDRVHSILEQDGLIIREQGRGTFVAGPERRTATHIIGCAGMDSLHNHLPYYLRLMRGMQQVLQGEGYELLILNQNSASLAWEKIDAVLGCSNFEELKGSVPPGMPAVNMIIRTPSVPSVVADDYRGVRLAVEHLVRLGHRRIGYLMEVDCLSDDRLRGYNDAMQLAGIEPEPGWVHHLVPFFGTEEFKGRGRETMRRWLENGWKELGLTALLTQNDRTAMGVLETLQHAGISVPRDLSLVGFDSTDECEVTSPRLTSVAVPLDEIGTRGAELLLEQIRGTLAAAETREIMKKESMETVVLPTRLEVRESTAPPAR